MKRLLSVVFATLLPIVGIAHAQQSQWLWWGATNPVPVTAANPLPVTVSGGLSVMKTDGSNSTSAALDAIATNAGQTGGLKTTDTPTFAGQILSPTPAATLSTSQAQAVGGSTLLPFAATTGAVVGQVVQGTSIPLGDEVASIVSTAQVTLTANGVSASGQKVLTTTATAGSAVGQQCTDLTTPTAIGAGNVIASIQAGVSITMTSNLTAATVNADQIRCDPVVTLTTATTAAVANAASINFIANSATLSSSSAFYNRGDASIEGNLNVGGALNLAQNAAGTFSNAINSLNSTIVSTENVNAGANLFATQFIQTNVNGTSTRADNGNFTLFSDMLINTLSSANNQSFAAIIGRTIAKTSTSISGYGLTGINANVGINTNITGVAQITGFESDMTVNSGANPETRVGYSTVLGSTDAVQGSTNDASFYWTMQAGTSPGWHNIFLLDGTNGTIMDTGGCILCTKASRTIAKGIDLSGWTISGNFLAGPSFTVNGVGEVGIGTAPTSTLGATIVSAGAQLKMGQDLTNFYTIGRNSGTGFLDVIGNQTGFIGIRTNGVVDAQGGYKNNGVLFVSPTAPTIASGGCTTGSAQSIDNPNGTAAFGITLGGATCGSTITLTMPAAATNWACRGDQQTAVTNLLVSTGAISTTAVVLTNVVRATGVAGNFTGATKYTVTCTGY